MSSDSELAELRAFLSEPVGEHENGGPWVYYMSDDALLKRRPWCDCTREHKIKVLGRSGSVGHGSTRRDDGVWVMPCCMRPSRLVWEKWGEEPRKHNPLDCRWCKERESNRGTPTLEELQATAKKGRRKRAKR